MKKRQVCIQLPEEVVRQAKKAAEKTRRTDGLKQTATATLREWLLAGMEEEKNNVKSRK
jgi:hypothetical protein